VPVGARVVTRPGRGPSLLPWLQGEVTGHQGRLYQVRTRMGDHWCDADDLLPDAPQRDEALTPGTRVWALWIDGRWYTGNIDGSEGRLRHVVWDDGDSMWLEPGQLVVLAVENQEPKVGHVVVAPRGWNGEKQPARVEQADGDGCRVVFGDGEEATVDLDDLITFPPNPFVEA